MRLIITISTDMGLFLEDEEAAVAYFSEMTSVFKAHRV